MDQRPVLLQEWALVACERKGAIRRSNEVLNVASRL